MKECACLLIVCYFVAVNVNGCCIPRQWEGLQAVSAGIMAGDKGIAMTALFKTSYDSHRRKIYAKGSGNYLFNGQPFEEELLYDYDKKVMYTVANGNCSTTPLPGTMFSCLPDNATLKLSSYYGFGNVTVPIEIYTFTIMDVAVTVTVGKKDCVLLGEHYVVPGSMVDSGFMGVTLGIKNPAVFDVPAKCKMCRKSNFAHEMETTHVQYRHQSVLTALQSTQKK